MLCANRPEGFGPLSHLYTHSLTSCYLDTILVPLCTWLYLLTVLTLFLLLSRSNHASQRETTFDIGPRQKKSRFGVRKSPAEDIEDQEDALALVANGKRSKIQLVLSILYYLLLLAQILMCVLEIARLSLAELGIGLLPFTFVTLLVAGALRFTDGLRGKVRGWRWASVGVWVALAVTNGVKIAEETKEGVGARMGTKYPESDEIIDVAVMAGVYAALALLEMVVRR